MNTGAVNHGGAEQVCKVEEGVCTPCNLRLRTALVDT